MDVIQHIVLFRFPGTLSEEDEAAMYEQIRGWPQTIANFRRLRFGKNVSSKSQGYEYLLFTEFSHTDQLRRYQDHPVHLTFADWARARGCEFLVGDYLLEPAAVLVGD